MRPSTLSSTGDNARRAAQLTALLAMTATACARGEPPGATKSGTSATSIATPVTTPTASATASSSTSSSASATTTATVAGPDPATLPQTHDKPPPDGADLEARARALWEAIVKDDPERAMPFFFPLAAYQQVKAIADPARDWRHRLVAAYARDVHALHAKLGAAASGAKLVRLEVPDARARWVEPNEEYNKIGYYRVFGSRLRYEIDGKESALEITSLISWRGQWYVVHLSGMK